MKSCSKKPFFLREFTLWDKIDINSYLWGTLIYKEDAKYPCSVGQRCSALFDNVLDTPTTSYFHVLVK